ncbi:MAG: hypothetical protein NVS2B7_16390 [Herpetosiphon sp.]
MINVLAVFTAGLFILGVAVYLFIHGLKSYGKDITGVRTKATSYLLSRLLPILKMSMAILLIMFIMTSFLSLDKIYLRLLVYPIYGLGFVSVVIVLVDELFGNRRQ